MMGKVRQGNKVWRIVGIYIGAQKGFYRVWMARKKRGGYQNDKRRFNAKTGGEDGKVKEGEEEKEGGEKRRQLRDGKMNKEDRLIEFIEGRGWSIFNG